MIFFQFQAIHITIWMEPQQVLQVVCPTSFGNAQDEYRSSAKRLRFIRMPFED